MGDLSQWSVWVDHAVDLIQFALRIGTGLVTGSQSLDLAWWQLNSLVQTSANWAWADCVSVVGQGA
jgi:hypothetical protein